MSTLPNCFIFLGLSLIFNFCYVNAVIPDYIQVCKRNDPNIDSCVANSINNLRQHLAQGIPELNVPGIEPLYIPRLELQDNVNLNLSELYIHGPSTFELIDMKADLNKNRFAFLYKFKELTFEGKYDIDMELLRVPLKSSGPIHGQFKNSQVTGKLHGKKMQINGKTHMVFRPIDLKIYQGQTSLRLDNLFRGQKALQDATNELLNENNELLRTTILPAIEKKFGEYFTLIANRITSRFTYDELFPLN